MRRKPLLASVMVLLLACMAAAASQQAGPERPRDPWVFRCVLDNQPRIVVIALHDDFYVAYDTTDCSFAKAWRGDVKFDGAVYTTVHGPQPTSEGIDLIRQFDDKPWTLIGGGKPREYPSPRWLGYRFINNQVFLRYSLDVGGETVVIVEQPEVEMIGEEMTFVRQLRVEGLAETTRLGVMIPVRDPSGAELRMFINDRPMKLKPNDTSRSIDLPLASSAPLKIVTYVPRAADAKPQPTTLQEP